MYSTKFKISIAKDDFRRRREDTKLPCEHSAVVHCSSCQSILLRAGCVNQSRAAGRTGGSPVLWHTAQVSWLVESRILSVSGKLKWTIVVYVVRKMRCIPRYASSLFHPDSSTIFFLLSLVYNVLIIFRGDTFSGLTDPKIQILSTPSQSDGWPTNLLSLLRRDGRHLRHGVQRHGSRLRNCEVRDWWVEMWKELTDSVHVMSICYVMVQILWWRSRDMSNMIEPFWQNLCSVMWARVSKVALLVQ